MLLLHYLMVFSCFLLEGFPYIYIFPIFPSLKGFVYFASVFFHLSVMIPPPLNTKIVPLGDNPSYLDG